MSETMTSASPIFWYGESGVGKTSAVIDFAEYVYEKTLRKTCVVTAESAGEPILRPGIDSGLIVPLWLSKSINPRATLKKLCRGEWQRPAFRASKDATPVPATPEKANTLSCFPRDPKEWDEIGAYVFEGFTSIAELCLIDLAEKNLKGEQKVETGLQGAGYKEDGEILASSSESQYGAAQKDVLQLAKEAPKALFDASKGKVQYVGFTSHSHSEKDKKSFQPITGPAFVGQARALTENIFKEVGTALHMVNQLEEVTGKKDAAGQPLMRRRVFAYFMDHRDPGNKEIIWKAKTRVPKDSDAHEKLLAKWPGGYVEFTLKPEVNIGTYLRFQDELMESATERLKKRMEELRAVRELPEKAA